MMLKIKSKEEDFKVEEIAALPLAKHGDFGVYILEKRGWNTTDALRVLAEQLDIPLYKFSYGGRKDRHAQTRQYITIEAPQVGGIDHERLALTFAGFMDRPMGPDLIDANRFEITVRNLSETKTESALAAVKQVRQFGLPNYFDDQRFGSFDAEQGFLAEKILLGHFNGAVKIYLTSIYSEDKKEDKDRKRFFIEHWKDWAACQAEAKTKFEADAFETLKGGEKAALAVLDQIEKEMLSLYFSAYQSFLWNEVARGIIREKIKDVSVSSGKAGDYIFYRELPTETANYFKDLKIPTAAHNTKMPDDLSNGIYANVLAPRGVQKPMFNKIKIRRAFFKATDRAIIIKPKDFTAEAMADDLQSGFQKLILKFTLPRGSYATMLLKRLFL